ncbi:NAD-dependent epimerase/dehydratase family protein [Terriglobus albidus]|uniref:NAD-dependent epimerase/dehydratase family protein n=1 Tax=Terriglobus albidus TaxID=1592106 RepID=UPI0021DFFBFD|nr:NAD-dependent epimerase/dehydratase family protein [Terriglobus albidus]
MNTLITGGAGFIGTHLARLLLAKGQEVTLLDSFLSQVHAGEERLPSDLAPHVRLVTGDVADQSAMSVALQGVDSVVHLAAETGTGQSMYEVMRYERTNLGGTATLYELLAKNPRHKVERIVVASSRAIYGEGAYRCEKDGIVYPSSRSVEDKMAGKFDPLCPLCGGSCETVPTTESAPSQPSSFYGLTKQVQEQTAMMFGQVLGIPSFGLRYQNVYGPGQSLKNPYTGILGIFCNLARAGRKLEIFEDGQESRDFVYVDDVVRATARCLEVTANGCHVVNVGSNERTTVAHVAEQVKSFYQSSSTLEVTGAFRDGDIRHGLADLGQAKALLDYEPQWRFDDGLRQFLEWAERYEPQLDAYQQSLKEMAEKGLLHGRS